MKLKNVKSLLSILLAGAMMVGTMAGCGSNETKKESSSAVSESKTESSAASKKTTTEAVQEAEGVTYPLEGNVTLTLALTEEGQVTSSGVKDLFETPFGKAWQEQTGVTIEVIQLADGDAMNLLFAGGDLPDLIWHNFNGYSGGPAKAIKDKIIEPLNDYTEYLPDMMEALNSDPDFIKAATTDDGDIVGGPFARSAEILKTSAGMMIRQDWLDELNLEVPQTPDEVYEVLKAFKEEKGAEAPLSLNGSFWLKSIALGHGLITSPFGLPKANLYQVDGTVHYGFYEQEYKDVLAWLNKLYTDGLLDANFQTVDLATVNSNIMNGVAGMTVGSTGGNMGTYLNTMKETDPNYNLTGMAPLVANKGDMPMSTHYDNAVTGAFLVMTPNCKDKEAAAKFINYGYTEEGHLLMNFGIEGESFTMVDGVPTYTDLILKNPDGFTVQQAMAQYQRAWLAGPMLQDGGYIQQYYALDQQKEALAAWSTSDAKKYQLPAIVIPEENSAELSSITSDINVYIEEMLFKYITGEKSLDTFETEYLPTLKSMGAERLIEINQKGLDNYNAR